MIPRANIVGWREHAPWPDEGQVEQDLVLCRAVVDIFNHPRARELLAFRGGTALHKIHLPPSARYSEDLDLVQTEPGPLKRVFDAIREVLDPWLGQPKTRQKGNGVQLLYDFETETQPVVKRRVKVEVNTREHFSVLGFVDLPFSITNAWFSGTAEVRTYRLDELLGTKLRAIYQRKKGRDVFDLWDAVQRSEIDPVAVVRCFQAYLAQQGLSVSKAEFEANLIAKAGDPAFEADIRPLLRSGTGYRLNEAVEMLLARFVALM